MIKQAKYAPLILIWIGLILPSFLCNARQVGILGQDFRLIPQPQKIQPLAGKGIFFNDIHNISLVSVGASLVVPGLLNKFPRTKNHTNSSILLAIEKDLALPSDEGYILSVKNQRIILRAKTSAGLFYGMQTLNQLLEDAQEQDVSIPPCKITDYPSIAVRAVHVDVKNHLDEGNYYYRLIDRLAAIKINNIVFEFEDKLRYKKAAYVAAGDAISIEDFIALSKYAKDRFIDISPLVQGLGHASFILKQEAYKDLRDNPASDWAFDPLNPKTYELQFSMYEEAIEATPFGKYLHVGGDEVGLLGQSDLSKASGKSPFELQMYWLKKVTDFAVEHHRIPIFWDDMVFKLSNLYQTTCDSTLSKQEVERLWKENRSILDKNASLFPRDCIYMRWNYDTPSAIGNILSLDWYGEHHIDAMAATSAQTYFAMMPRNQSNFQPIKEFCQLTASKKLKGILCTVWDDSSPHFETTWRGIHDFAWFSWNDKDYSEEVVHASFRHRFYGPQLADGRYEFQNMLEQAVNVWDTAFVVNGDRENFHETFKLVDLPDKAGFGAWSALHKDRLKAAEKAILIYGDVKKRLVQCLKLTNRNRYSLQVFGQINELQVYSSRLLILLQQYDNVQSRPEKSLILNKIENYKNQFAIIRLQLEKVYSLTRKMTRPEGYKMDANIRSHLASSTYNTDWMYWYELAMNKKVSNWIRQNRIQ